MVLFARRRLGASEIEVTPVGLGCWQFSGGQGIASKFWEALPQERVDAIVKAALDGGMNWFDTAEIYGRGRSEEALARALCAAGKQNGDVIVATKWWPALRFAASIKDTIGERLRRLGGYGIDLHQVHQPFSFSSIAAEMNAMADLVEAAQVKTVGVSNFSAARMRAAHAALGARKLSLASNQVRYNLLDRRIERDGTLAAARELGVTLIAYSPLAQGILSGKFHDDPSLVARTGLRRWMPWFRGSSLERSRPVVAALREIAKAYGVTPSQVALNWVLHFQGPLVVAIPGATRVGHAEEAAGAMSFELARTDLDQLDRLTREL
jgi:aryl-alcohol dehydrogenase-like predicted oxidoreductase